MVLTDSEPFCILEWEIFWHTLFFCTPTILCCTLHQATQGLKLIRSSVYHTLWQNLMSRLSGGYATDETLCCLLITMMGKKKAVKCSKIWREFWLGWYKINPNIEWKRIVDFCSDTSWKIQYCFVWWAKNLCRQV